MNLAPSASYATVFGVQAKPLAFCDEAGPSGESASRSNRRRGEGTAS
jgi:hypothetical protein